MDELDLFRGFRSRVVAPSADAERRASARLSQAIERRYGRGTGVLRLIGTRPGRTALVVGVLAGAAAAALFVGAPWKDSPGFLERAQAALAPPEEAPVVHYKWEMETRKGPTCAPGRNEIWIDQTPPYAYRALLTHCGGGRTIELGGALDTGETLVFVPPDKLTVPDAQVDAAPDPVDDLAPDPVTGLREAIRDGRAYDEGKTQLDGRTVERIRVDCPAEPCDGPQGYVYVDPETFAPVQVVIPGGLITEQARFDLVVRYLTFEYLPRTAANLALTDIRAQHPDATGP